MLASSIPGKFQLPFAGAAGASFIRPIPAPSQTGVNPGAASLTTGFPPVTFIDPSAGEFLPTVEI